MTATPSLLFDERLHAEREVGRAVELVGAGREAGEGDLVGVLRVQKEWAREWTDRVRHRLAELRGGALGDAVFPEHHVVRRARDQGELHLVAARDRDFRRRELVAGGVADHLDLDRFRGDGTRVDAGSRADAGREGDEGRRGGDASTDARVHGLILVKVEKLAQTSRRERRLASGTLRV